MNNTFIKLCMLRISVMPTSKYQIKGIVPLNCSKNANIHLNYFFMCHVVFFSS